jgi:hypothetical protein
MANSSQDAWWRREINEWLDKLDSPKKFIDALPGAGASFQWKQMAVEMSLKRWPQWKSQLKKMRGTR